MSRVSGLSVRTSAPNAGVIAAAMLVGVAAGAGIAALVTVAWVRQQGDRSKASARNAERDEGADSSRAELEQRLSSSSVPTGRGGRLSAGSWHEADITPPLPDDVVRLLRASRLCFLSTFCDDHPHLSLMNFTYHAEDEVIILSTRRDTKKYKLVQKANHVAILVHEFPSTGSGSVEAQDADRPLSPRSCSRKVTITLNGTAKIQDGAQAEKYRNLHVEKNPDSKTFIVGPDIAIITVRVQSARICNIRDEVTFWDVSAPSPANHVDPEATTGG